MEDILISLKNVKKKYKDKEIIKNLDLDIYKGEFLTLLGSSGCGKSTILKMISGIESVTDGSIIMEGKDITNLDSTKREINTIFQNYALFPHMTIEDNIGFGLKIKKVDKKIIQKEVKKMLNLVKLEGYENRYPSELSGGEQQRVAIARAIINNPKVLLLDEPLSALDKKLRKEMEVELKNLQKKLGITFIYVTHDHEEALTMSDRIIILNKGKIEQIDTPSVIYNYPKTKYVATFIGDSNIFEGLVVEPNLVRIDGLFDYKSKENLKVGDKELLLIRPENIKIVKNSNIEFQKTDYIYNGPLSKVYGKLKNGQEIKITVNDYDYNRDYHCLSFDNDDIVLIK